jgi:hypothetical protein
VIRLGVFLEDIKMKPTIFPCKEPWSGLIKTELEMAGSSQHKPMYHKLAPPRFEFELSVDLRAG